jgi:hypothetical protein
VARLPPCALRRRVAPVSNHDEGAPGPSPLGTGEGTDFRLAARSSP